VLVLLLALAAVALPACSSGSDNSKSSSSSKSDDPADQTAGDAKDAAYTPTGNLLADDGFRPEANGFAFENYGGELPSGSKVTNLTAEDMRKIFGDNVCADAACDLVPPAQAWMDDQNSGMNGGHCEGFSNLAQMFWAGKTKADDYGSASVPDLEIDDNTALQREIATAFVFQALPSVEDAQVHGTPNEILEKLKEALKPNPSDIYTVGIYKADHTGGHAVTPYGVEDKGNGVEDLLIYDNNYPGVTRRIEFDTNANTWTYNAATNPNEPSEKYEGTADTNTIELDPLAPALGTQTDCPFCDKVRAAKGSSGGSKGSAAAQDLDQIWLEGGDVNHGHLLVTDPAGHRLGIVNGAVVNEIPGARILFNKAGQNWREQPEPDYYVPDGDTYTVTVDGTGLPKADDTSIGVIGPSFEAQVDDISLEPGDKDTFVFEPDATKMSYVSSRSESPTISLGFSDDTADYEFTVTGVSDEGGSTLNLALPLDSTDFTVDPGGTGSSTVALEMVKLDSQGKQEFKHDGIALTGDDSATLKYGDWSNGEPLQLVVTRGGTPTNQTLDDEG
jgi:hypothetical protein